MWWVSKESLRPWLRLTVTLPYIWLVERSAGLHWCKDIYCAPVSIREVKTCDLWVPADQTISELLFMWVQIYFGRLKCKESLMLFFIGVSDGKIVVHSRRSDVPVEFSGHNQEVNCVDAKDGLIISGSRDRTARVRTTLRFGFIMWCTVAECLQSYF